MKQYESQKDKFIEALLIIGGYIFFLVCCVMGLYLE